MDKSGFLLVPLLVVLTGVLFGLNLVLGSVNIPFREAVAILSGHVHDMPEYESWRYIIMESRLPQAIVALLAGPSLALSGLMLQSAFRNSLAGPDVFGVSSGAGLAVALVMLGLGGSVSVGGFSMTGFLAIFLAAFIGAMLVMCIITAFSELVRNQTVLLIVGIMIGYLSGSATSLLNFFASSEGVKSYMVWGMGSFGNVALENIPLFSMVCLVGLSLSFLLVKPLNALLLGEQYAENLGFNVRHLRRWLLVVTGLLTAIVTAFCGPIAFIGLATPHIGRLLLSSENHRKLMPSTMLLGAVIALLCNLICSLPGEKGMIPLNAVTPIFGAPVIIYVIAKRHI